MYMPLKVILEIQELDMKRIRLMRLKKDCLKEFHQIEKIEKDAKEQLTLKEGEVLELKKSIRSGEGEIEQIKSRIKELEEKQNVVKKVEEFNALSNELSTLEREKVHKEQKLSDLYDKQSSEEDVVIKLKDNLTSTQESSSTIKEEISSRVDRINEEGKVLDEEREKLVVHAEPEIFAVYERLLRNKKDRVVVPIENRTCTGCNIVLTPQHENVVRKGERLVFCEHCSRIHYWQESTELEGSVVATKRRRRRAETTTK